MSKKTRTLIVDGDLTSQKSLRDAFSLEGYEVAYTASGAEAIMLTVSWQPELVILDAAPPDINGRDVLRVLRKHSKVGIIIVSSKPAGVETIEFLDLGANDVVSRPVSTGELLARSRSVLRNRMKFEAVTLVYQAGNLTIDVAARAVTLDGKALRLTAKEFEVLHILASADGRVVSQRQLIEMTWGIANSDGIQYLRVFVGRLRKKIEKDPAEPTIIVTERGVGYRFIASGRVIAE